MDEVKPAEFNAIHGANLNFPGNFLLFFFFGR